MLIFIYIYTLSCYIFSISAYIPTPFQLVIRVTIGGGLALFFLLNPIGTPRDTPSTTSPEGVLMPSNEESPARISSPTLQDIFSILN